LIQPPELRSTLTEFGTRESGGKELAGCIVGGFWRKNYGLKLGDRVTFLFSDEDDNARTVAFVIIGFFEGNNPYLENAAYIDRRLLAEKLNVKGSAKTLFVWLNDSNRKDLDALRERIRVRMQNAFLRDVKGFEQLSNRIAVETWQEKDNGFYKAMTAENRLMRAIMVFFLALLAFIIYLIFGRLVAEKIRDIGTLRALGCTPGQIRMIFLGQALLIGVAGCAAGVLFALLLIGNLNSILQFLSESLNLQLFPPDLFGPNRVLTRVLPLDVVLICGLTLAFSLLGALLPAVRASRLNPVECLRHE
jgi:lipoprotein-releasing system permease protein